MSSHVSLFCWSPGPHSHAACVHTPRREPVPTHPASLWRPQIQAPAVSPRSECIPWLTWRGAHGYGINHVWRLSSIHVLFFSSNFYFFPYINIYVDFNLSRKSKSISFSYISTHFVHLWDKKCGFTVICLSADGFSIFYSFLYNLCRRCSS